jgi:hypothetical protein
MNRKYFDQLLPDTKELVLLIESVIEKEITVREVAERNNLGCEIDSATILTPEDRFPDSSVLHELLHIRRFKVDGIPQLAVCDTYDYSDPDFETSVTKLDNNIEHLFIVPEEINLRPDRHIYWENRINQAATNLENPRLNINSFGCDVIINWLFAKYILVDSPTVKKTTKLVRQLDLEEKSRDLLSMLLGQNCSKELFSRAYLAKLEMPANSLCLKYLDREESL